jgi:nucleoside-diphosphate-sugar epimerase
MAEGVKPRVLVTGATGQIGSELVPMLRKKYGGQQVVAVGHKRMPSEEMLRSGPFEQIDLGDEEQISRSIKKFDIDTIYHLAAVLSAVGEQDPQAAWNINMQGLYNILEASRKMKLERVFWPSSIGVFGPTSPRLNTPQDTVLLPTSMYGVTKVAGELLCNYYALRYNLDVRSVRYPGIISSVTPPGGGTTDYAVEIFYEAILSGRYTCFLREDTKLPMMYMPDSLKAAIDIMEAPGSKIKRHDGYNVTAMSFSAGELAAELSKHFPHLRVDYVPDSRQKIADSWPMSLDDSVARQDWGWKPLYDLPAMTKDMVVRLSKRLK